MSFSATRLTCFAIIAALEDDMRSNIEAAIGDMAINDALPSERVERAQSRRAVEGLSAAESLPGLLPYLDFADSYELLMARRQWIDSDLVASLASIGRGAARLIAIRNRVAHTRPMEIDDSAYLLDLARELTAEVRYWPTLVETIERLTANPSYVLGLTIRLPKDPAPGPQHNLPVPDFDETGFFGRKDQLRRIKKAIKGAYPVVSILGDGGVGKTSIALKVAYELLDDPDQQFDAFVWVTAKATVLTVNEIQRISDSIENSLGLFAQAARELGPGDAENPVAEVLGYLGSFRILLLLDNLETVLDERLREFLLDLPIGSKVIITSRIGLGIENPVRVEPLDKDEANSLLRALVRIRNVRQLQQLPPSAFDQLAERMGGHPAYLRWFVAGVQAGRRPEELLADNKLLLDFCMSNVHEYLGEDARTLVRSMQVLPGPRSQAELAFINEFTAERVQAALLELLTTNFVQMLSQPQGTTLDTAYQLSDFARQYLDKRHAVRQDERTWLLNKSQELRDLGMQLTAEVSTTPYSSETVNVRTPGDVHVAKLLRDAVRSAPSDMNFPLSLCSEAQVLAPGYYEAWRVEAHVRALHRDFAGAAAAYERALELAPDSSVLLYHYGTFLLNDAGDAVRARGLLQSGARLDADSVEIAGQIAWAHYCLDDFGQCIEACRHLLSMRNATHREKVSAAILAHRAATYGVRRRLDALSLHEAGELLETALELAEEAPVELLGDEPLDRLLLLRQQAGELASEAENYLASKAKEYSVRLLARQRCVAPDSMSREVGSLKALKSDKGFGFVASRGVDYFAHYRDLVDPADWDRLREGVSCAFDALTTERGPRASRLRVLE